MEKNSQLRLSVIEQYLNINGQPARYYVHDDFKKFNLFPKRVYVGKGSPNEIKKALAQDKSNSLRIGIDYSGFICHVIEATQPITSVIKHPSTTLLIQLRYMIRPIEKISVSVLIDPINSTPINEVDQIRTWDLINVGDQHVMLVYQVLDNTISYVHSSEKEKFVTKNKIRITDINKPLEEQMWFDHSTKEYFKEYTNSGVVRLKRDKCSSLPKKDFLNTSR